MYEEYQYMKDYGYYESSGDTHAFKVAHAQALEFSTPTAPSHLSFKGNPNSVAEIKSFGNCTDVKFHTWNTTSSTSTGTARRVSVSTTSIKPIWVASFPGSGAEMFRQVIETITYGVYKGWSIYDDDVEASTTHTHNATACHSLRAATCKTHWPVLPHHSPSSEPLYKQQYASQAIVLLRNPRAAFASRLNHLWELQHNVAFHSQQAPEKAWNRWIARNFQQQIAKYKLLIQTWAQHPHYNVSLYLPYEGLTDPNKGPQWTQRVRQLLQHQQHAQLVANASQIPCLWRLAVLEQPRVKRQGHSYSPGYTTHQKQAMLQMMDELLGEVAVAHNLPSLVKILSDYRQDIATHTRIRIDGDEILLPKKTKPKAIATK
jgi:hypothetical protein